ncbi:MAG: hypothetical protein V4459_01090 [Pseudomonadota bacterium]
MTRYWRHQKFIDVVLALALAIIAIRLGKAGYRVVEYDPGSIKSVAANWFGAILSLFGLVAAIVAFVFSAIEGPEFKILRESKSKYQLWDIFSITLISLCFSSIWCAVLSISSITPRWVDFVAFINCFLIILNALLLLKFTWVMTRIIAVKSK